MSSATSRFAVVGIRGGVHLLYVVGDVAKSCHFFVLATAEALAKVNNGFLIGA